MQDSNIKVSVCIVTYNQEKYIGECLDSLVSQQTSFPFEVIVGDDASSDRTPEIIQKYYEKYPNIIVPVLREKNLGPVGNTVDVYKRAKGQYIAHLDGDDMALPGKLQAQADTLDANPDCTICAHNVWMWDGKLSDRDFSEKLTGKYNLLDLYCDLPFFAHSSKMFRNDLQENYWKEFSEVALDVTVHIEQAKKGNIYYLQDHLGVYRQFIGISESGKRLNPKMTDEVIRLYEVALKEQRYPVDDIQKAFAQACLNFARGSIGFDQPKDFRRYIKISCDVKQISKKQKFLYYLSYSPSGSIKVLKILHSFKRAFKNLIQRKSLK